MLQDNSGSAKCHSPILYLCNPVGLISQFHIGFKWQVVKDDNVNKISKLQQETGPPQCIHGLVCFHLSLKDRIG